MARPFDQTAIQIKRLGPPPGRARRELLFIHGAWHGPWYWEPLAAPLAADGFACNLLALPGHGDEPWDLPGFTRLSDYALYSARAAAGLPGVVLIGHSLGGWIVQKILEAADLPAVLLCPLPARGMTFIRLLALVLRTPLGVLAPLWGRPMTIGNPALARRLFYRQLPLEQVRPLWEPLVAEPAVAALQMGLGLCPTRTRPGRAPRLLVAGQKDFLVPPAVLSRLARRLGARFELLAGMPHNPWLEDPGGRVLALVREFLGYLEAGRSASP